MGTGMDTCVTKWPVLLMGSADLQMKLWATKHPILQGSLHPACAHLALLCIIRNYIYHVVKGIE